MTTNMALLQEAMEKVRSWDAEVIVDFDSLPRIDASVVDAVEELASLAGDRSCRVLLRAVNADVYRVLKQLKLSERFGFLNG